MKSIHIAIVGLVFAIVVAPAFSADAIPPAGQRWSRTRNTATKDLFPADAAGAKIQTVKSSDFFPADPAKQAVKQPVKPKPRSGIIRRMSALQRVLRFPEDRPVFPVRVAQQPPAAPPSSAVIPPAPKGANVPPPAGANIPMPDAAAPVEGGFSPPMDTEGVELTEVGEVLNEDGSCCDDGCGYDDWCHRHCWCRSTCDMPLHFPYYPQDHGYYYFRPYNFRHVQMHSEMAPLLGGNPKAPYATEMFKKFYAEVPDVDKYAQDDRLPPVEKKEERLPNLEETLEKTSNPPVPPQPKVNKKP